jgi:hypothetical protein
MERDESRHTVVCEGLSVCLQAKPDKSAYPSKLQPLPIPTEAWEIVLMDFIDGLLRSATANCIMVVVDKFTRFAHLIPISHPYIAVSVASVFMDLVYRLHGLSAVIISDRDPVFTSKFWSALFKQISTTLKMSSSYHPQTDGQTERVN